jgi:hypothetical protein
MPKHRPERFRHEARVGMDGHENDPDREAQPSELTCDFEAGHTRHGDVAYDHVGRKPPRFRENALAVGHGGHDVGIRLQDSPKPFQERRMVIGENQAQSGRSFHHFSRIIVGS